VCSDSSGSGTVQSCTTIPSDDPTGSSAIAPTAGDQIIYKTTTTNTGDLTINVNAAGAVHVRKNQGLSILGAGDIQAGVYVPLTYDGPYWEIGGLFITVYSAAGTPLPTCNTAYKGQKATVSDATSPTYLGTYTSGGAVIAPVFCNGTTWLTD
jgi:hypothetical protein